MEVIKLILFQKKRKQFLQNQFYAPSLPSSRGFPAPLLRMSSAPAYLTTNTMCNCQTFSKPDHKVKRFDTGYGKHCGAAYQPVNRPRTSMRRLTGREGRP